MVILGFDIGAALIPDVSLLEMVVRGAIMYFSIFILLRVLLRGRTSAVTVSDLLVLVLIADAAQNAMASDYHSITAGLVLVAHDRAVQRDRRLAGSSHSEPVRRFVHPERKPLVIDGRVIRKTLVEELMTEGELMTQIRLNGVEDLDEVKAAYLEGNGEVSVIKRDGRGEGKQGSAAARAV